jgi:predicted metalloprotease with PDZ domain
LLIGRGIVALHSLTLKKHKAYPNNQEEPMKKKHLVLLLLAFGTLATAQFQPRQEANNYHVLQDLTAVENDRLPIIIVCPKIEDTTAEFHMPRIIPGTYDVHNYGRFVQNLTALAANGDTLPLTKLDLNRWSISQANRLYKLTYQVDDTYDYEGEDLDIFEPAGTSQEDSVFLLNNFGYVGYIKGFESVPYTLNIRKPKGFYGATALSGKTTDTLDQFQIDDYFSLHDNPIMYNLPDTAWHEVGGAQVLVSVYSPNGLVTAEKCMEEITRVLDATATYLGGQLPVDKYAVLVYCIPLDQAGNSYGALEHHTSTVLYMPEADSPEFYAGVRDITSHEFFHIITPLRIHSQYVADFDFINPEMSEHIWLYEGVTEYNSHLVQVRDGIYDTQEFIDVLGDKLESNDRFNQEVPLTMASRYTLGLYKNQYLNFYQKGAIVGMAVDLKLIELSEGKYRLIDLLTELGNVYGTDTFFVDEDLFEIMAQTAGYPELEEFLVRHIASAEALPLNQLFDLVGINYYPSITEPRITIGGFSLGYNFETERLMVRGADEMNAFGQKMGFKEGDELLEIQGLEVSYETLQEVLNTFYGATEVGDKVKVKVARKEEDGSYDEETLKAKAALVPVERLHVFEINDTSTKEQLELRKAWINQ